MSYKHGYVSHWDYYSLLQDQPGTAGRSSVPSLFTRMPWPNGSAVACIDESAWRTHARGWVPNVGSDCTRGTGLCGHDEEVEPGAASAAGGKAAHILQYAERRLVNDPRRARGQDALSLWAMTRLLF